MAKAVLLMGSGAGVVVLPSWQDEGNLSKELWQQRLLIVKDNARKFGVFVSAHGWVNDKAGAVSRCCLVDDSGEICLIQDQTHHFEGGLTVSDTLEPARTAIGTVGFLAGDDALVPEVGRILRLQGADLFISYTSFPAPANPWRQWAGIWQQVQQNQVFALESSDYHGAYTHQYAGRALIHAPCEITEQETGFLAVGNDQQLLSQPLDYNALNAVRKSYPLHKFYNAQFYKKYLTKWYRR